MVFGQNNLEKDVGNAQNASFARNRWLEQKHCLFAPASRAIRVIRAPLPNQADQGQYEWDGKKEESEKEHALQYLGAVTDGR